MVEKEYPKVLIIGAPFSKSDGGGITMSNLFQDWPKSKLALASTSNIREKAEFTICDNYYQLTYKGKLHPFPLNLLLHKVETGPVKLNPRQDSQAAAPSQSGKYKRVYKILNSFLSFTGLFNFFYGLKLTDEFLKWVEDYDPDIIYTQLASLVSIRFVRNVRDLSKKPVAIHIMDDWPVSINKPSLLYFYWKKRTDREFRDLIEASPALLSICQGMSDEYRIRYNRVFHPFHNPIIIDRWLPFSRNDWSVKEPFKILYTGRVGVANGRSIMLIAEVINELNRKNQHYVLDIYSPDFDSNEANKIRHLSGVNINSTIENRLMPELLSKYDLLFLPLDFDHGSIKFARFSMPTKASEYMISGVPVLVFADVRTYLAKHAKENGWACVVSENNRPALQDALVRLSSDIDLRTSLAKRAMSFAKENEDARIIRDEFRKKLIIS